MIVSAFTDKLVDVAMDEWRFFGSPYWNIDGTTQDGKKEQEDGARQRIGDYWRPLGGPYANLNGSDHGYPWSAAFISFCMRTAGAGKRFSYSPAHATYINASIRAAAASSKTAAFYGLEPSSQPVSKGDLIGYWRGNTKITVKTALQTGWYQSHTDIVTEVGKGFAYVIGGNVGHSVTRKQVKLNTAGILTDERYSWFVLMSNRL